MCDQFGTVCRFCRENRRHPPSSSKKVGEYWRKHQVLELAIGKHEREKFERHYADHGILVEHKETACGDLVPKLTDYRQFERILKARGMA